MEKPLNEFPTAIAAMPDAIRKAHGHSSGHRSEVASSDICGCFYCGAIFPPGEILEWIDDGKTALCPKCTVDSVLGSSSGFPITTEFLEEMRRTGFLEPAKELPQ